MALVTLTDVKPHLNITASRTVNDAELQGFIDAATAVIEEYVGPVLPRTVTQLVSPSGTTILAGPVLSVTSVTDAYGLPTTTYVLDSAAGVLTGTTPTFYPTGTLQAPSLAAITYTAGLASVPPTVRLATCFVVADLWNSSQRGSVPAPANGGDSNFGYLPRASDDLPPRARMLLAPYRRAPRVG